MAAITQAIQDQAQQIIETMQAKVSRAQTGMLTNDAIQRVAAKAYIDASNAMADLRANFEDGQSYSAQQLQQQLFGSAAVSGADAISQRDAMDRAAQLDDPAEASALLERCSWSGDTVLARAIAQHAFAMARNPFFASAWTSVVNEYAATQPDLARRLSELAAVQQNSTNDRIRASFVFAIPKPTSIGLMADYQIAALAAQPQPEGF